MEMPSYISTRLHYQHKTLIELIEGLGDEQIRKHVVTGKWSIFENIVHLQTYQHVFISRVRELLEGNTPLFGRYTAEADPLFLDNCAKSSREILQDLISTRKEMASSLLSLPQDDLIKTGRHPVYGELNLLQWLNFFLLHEAHHLYTVFQLSAAFTNHKL